MREYDSQKVEFIQELYDTYEDIKNHNITLKRIYVILILTIIVTFGFLGITMLFAKEFFISSLYIICACLFYALLLNRKKKSVARYLDWFSFMGGGVCIIIAICCNIYLYSMAGGAHLYIILLATLIYIMFINDSKKRLLIANITYVALILTFVIVFLIDYYFWHSYHKESFFSNLLFVISVVVVFSSIVFSNYVVGLKSIEDIEKLSANKNNAKITKQVHTKFNLIDKKDFTQLLLQRQQNYYNNLNVCIFEIAFFQKDQDSFFRTDYYYQNKVMKEFLSLLRAYYPNDEIIIKWDLNTFVLILEEESSKFYFLLESISKDFDKMIRKKKDNFDIYLKIVAKYHKFIDTQKRPKVLLEKINETIKLKYETKTMGREYILYKSGYDDII
ncbi:hypothetical protein AVBRAN12642_05420 [Campylobacter sp. RM12642]|uniref:hypothetical protein n=1 Tax=Campylobacter sp. RM12642 TaxID=2735736 RepID=UPI0030155845|nr:hypothetical protein [Campylobacter sp. RM12642]